MPIVTCAVTHSAPKKVLSLGHKSKGVDELNMRGRVFEISPNGISTFSIQKSITLHPNKNGTPERSIFYLYFV